MVIVVLKDGTQYMMDTEIEYDARTDVESKLRDRIDYREIVDTIHIPAKLDKTSNLYNPVDFKCDNTPLKASKGWCYKWGDTSASFR